MPMTFRSTLRTAPPVTSSMRKAEETTASRFLAPPVPPHHGDQKPSRNFKNRVPTREIAVVFPNSGQPTPSPISFSPPTDRSEPSSWSRSLLQPPHWIVAIAAPSEVPIHRSFLAVKPSPLAPLPSSTPAIFGDETTVDWFARKSSAFLLLVASAEEPPFAADADGKLADELCCCRCCFLLTEPMTANDVAFSEEFGFYC